MMNSALKIMKPSALVGILFLVILLVQGACFTSGSMTYSLGSDRPDKMQSTYGVGSPITVTTADGATSRDINWPILLTDLAISYVLAAFLAGAFARATRFRRPATAYATVALVMIMVSFVVSIAISRSYWGYYFARPSVLNEVHDVASVSAVVPVKTVSDSDRTRRMVMQDDYSIADRIAYGRKDKYYCLDERLLLAFDDAELLPPAHATDWPVLPALFPLLQQTGILAEPEDGYNDSDLLQGVVIDTLSKSGQRLVFLGLNGPQLSNDHYPYYEMVFTGDTGLPALSYMRGQRFFYDVAGIEGAEWFLIWPFLALVGVVIGFIVLTVFMLIWRLIKRTRKAQQTACADGIPPAAQP